MGLDGLRKQSVRESYDREAELYRRSSDVQRINLAALFAYARPKIEVLKPRNVIDIGCGLGPAIEELKLFSHFDDAGYLGIDLSPQMIALAKDIHRHERVQFRAGDAEALDVPDGSMDLVIANAMIHWLNQPKLGNTPARALGEMHRVLKPGGLAIFSTPDIEALRFRMVYWETVRRCSHESYFNGTLYSDDPLGSLQLFELVELLKAALFRVEIATTYYHTYEFSSAAEYASSVKAYGYGAYMLPFAPEMHATVWDEIVAAFEKSIGPGPYLHEIYQNYVVARKPDE